MVGPLSLNHRALTFNGEQAQVVDTRFVNEVIWVSEIIHDGDLAKIEKESSISLSRSPRCVLLEVR